MPDSLRIADRPALALGIDPGEKTGLAVTDPAAGRTLAVASLPPRTALDFAAALADDPAAALCSLVATGSRLPEWTLRHLAPDADGNRPLPRLGFVVVEDARALPIYARHNGVKGRARDRIARSVGRIDAQTDMIEDLLRHLAASHGIAFALREPVRSAKWSADDLARYANYTEPTNEHGRDAARLIHGLTPAGLRQMCAAYASAPTRQTAGAPA